MATWLKIDDTMVENPKCVDLSPFAWTLWLHGVSYCSRNLTDGHIPQAMLPRLTSITDPGRAADELVDAGMWHATEDGYEVHDYLDHQRSRSDVEADRAKATERQRRSRANRSDVTDTSRCDTDVTPTAESVSVSAGEPSPHLTTATTGRADQVAERVIEHRLSHQTGIRNPAAWRRRALDNLRADIDWWQELERCCAKWPDAPVDMLAQAAEGDKSPHLRNYEAKATA
jgi:hypothetical protein